MLGYARVSSQQQKADLERQINDFKQQYPNHEIVKDIASGLNYQRKGLLTLLEKVHQGDIYQVVVGWLLTETDSVLMDSNSWSGSLKKTAPNS